MTTPAQVYLACTPVSGTYSLLNAGFADNTMTFIPVDTLLVDVTAPGG